MYGDIKITLLKEETLAEYTVRTFALERVRVAALVLRATHASLRDASRAAAVQTAARDQRCRLCHFVATFSEHSDPSIRLFLFFFLFFFLQRIHCNTAECVNTMVSARSRVTSHGIFRGKAVTPRRPPRASQEDP